MIWVIGQPEGATHTQQYSDIQTNTIYSQNMTFKKIGKINCALRADILFSEFINIYVAARARVFRKYFAELVPVFI